MAKALATTKARPQPEAGGDAPLIDALGATVKKMVAKGKEQGFVTYDDLNTALPPDQVSSEQIETTMSQLPCAKAGKMPSHEVGFQTGTQFTSLQISTTTSTS